MEPNVTIEKLRLKIADRDGGKSDSFSLLFNWKMLEDNKTLADYNIHEGSFIFVGYLYKINFEGVIYKKGGIGCGCCGGRGDFLDFYPLKLEYLGMNCNWLMAKKKFVIKILI